MIGSTWQGTMWSMLFDCQAPTLIPSCSSQERSTAAAQISVEVVGQSACPSPSQASPIPEPIMAPMSLCGHAPTRGMRKVIACHNMGSYRRAKVADNVEINLVPPGAAIALTYTHGHAFRLEQRPKCLEIVQVQPVRAANRGTYSWVHSRSSHGYSTLERMRGQQHAFE